MPHTIQIETSLGSFVSGYGVMMEQEHELQSSLRKALDAVDGRRIACVGRLLLHQQTLVAENITRLEELYESLPHADRFEALHHMLPPLSRTRPAPGSAADSGMLLSVLVAQHFRLAIDVDKLRAHSPHPGEDAALIEVARNHQEMAWALTSLLMDEDSMRRRTDVLPSHPLPAPETAEKIWENEGGALRTNPATAHAQA